MPAVGRKRRQAASIRVITDRVALRGDGVGVVHETRLRFANGQARTWTYLIKRPFVMVIALTGRRVVLVWQHRWPARRAWEVVKGGVERGETPLAAAKRELREETGFTAQYWKSLGQLMVAPGYFNQVGHVYIAQKLRAGTPQPETNGELLRVALATETRVRQLMRLGGIYDSTTMAGLLLARKYFAL